MKKSTSTALYSPFTATLTKAIKTRSERLYCQVDEADEHKPIFVTNGQILVKLLPCEYDEFIRPVSQRDPGDWTLDANGQPIEGKPFNMVKVFSDYSCSKLHPVQPAPFTLSERQGKKSYTFTAFYSAEADFVAGFDSAYTAIVDPSRVDLRSSGPNGGMIAADNASGDPIALILPVRLQNSRMISAVRAYFTDAQSKTKTDAQPDEADRLRAQLTDANNERARLTVEADELRAQLAAAQAIAQAAEQKAADAIAAAQDAASAAQPQPKTYEQPAALEAIVTALEAMPGISATVKGGRTASPVVWISGDADPHKAALEKLGAKWSGKRSAYYVQVKAA